MQAAIVGKVMPGRARGTGRATGPGNARTGQAAGAPAADRAAVQHARTVVCHRCGHEHHHHNQPDARADVGGRLMGFCGFCGCVRWLAVVGKSTAETLLRYRSHQDWPKKPGRAA